MFLCIRTRGLRYGLMRFVASSSGKEQIDCVLPETGVREAPRGKRLTSRDCVVGTLVARLLSQE